LTNCLNWQLVLKGRFYFHRQCCRRQVDQYRHCGGRKVLKIRTILNIPFDSFRAGTSGQSFLGPHCDGWFPFQLKLKLRLNETAEAETGMTGTGTVRFPTTVGTEQYLYLEMNNNVQEIQ
jgi:hypothetical protein